MAASTGTARYTLHSKRIVRLTNSCNSLHFFRDAQNNPAVVVFSGTRCAPVDHLPGECDG